MDSHYGDIMWYYIASVPLAIINALDILINVVAVKIAGFNLHNAASLNALWTLVLLFSSRSAERYSYYGFSKRSILMGTLALTMSTILLYLTVLYSCTILIYISYGLHAIAYIYFRIGVQTELIENYYNYEWAVSVIRVG